MKQVHKALFITPIPSPYQRDLFGALATRNDVDLSVYYMDAGSPENPWPEKPLRSFEKILPGFSLPFGRVKMLANWHLPNISEFSIVVLSTFTSLTGQWLMRGPLRGKRWLFWGERLQRNSGLKAFVQESLAAPISHAYGIVGIGSAAQNDYRRRFPTLKHFYLPYHCDLADFFSIDRRRKAGAPMTFLFCGQMIRRKGVDLLLVAFDRLIAKGLDAQLLLVGREANLPEFLEVLTPAARSRICYESFKAPECLPEYFEKSDVFVLPSRYDGWGVVINQALAAGLPIITTEAVGAGLDFVEDGINGMRVLAGSVESLYTAMETIALNPHLACEWGNQSRERARTLTPEEGAKRWVQIFDEMCARED